MEKNHVHLADNIIELYQKHAKAWTALRGKYLYEKKWLDLFLAHLIPQSNLLDLGCGSAQPIAEYLIQHHHSVVGIDSADQMIQDAQINFPQHIWLKADMRELQLNEQFDGILAWDSFFHLKPNDQRAMFNQFEKFSKQGGLLMFTTGPSYGEAIGELFGDALYHASLSLEEYRYLLANSGFEVITMIAEDPECTKHTVWLAQKIAN
ncbi:SAM-dependent methyltransferase [Acinetobacter sp. ANC 4558]|uniref:class I SAM-dependent methyltransferase n=1 Tax=Acinetobacter sp. ANC 4558 TaxID=1977876 RepID=UPI000A33B8AD|nr:class I SAM-dependent methyltransferase [Acinetobacter sp. ANC 4558]OTG85576.1 SAM-dependent methyltransferase [Acinetobacter sp. ANC 4558]